MNVESPATLVDAPGAEHLISGDITSDEAIPFRGCIDGFDPDFGVSGWALNLTSPESKIGLEFIVDGVVVSACATMGDRADIAALLPQHHVAPRFEIGAGIFLLLGNLLKIRPNADFAVRIAGTPFILPRLPEFPRLADIVHGCAGAARPVEPHFDLYGHLMQARALSAPIARLPLRKQEHHRKGFIEALCVEDQGAGLLWFVGWTSEPNLFDEPAVIVDSRKYPAAFSIIRYTRDDLPAGAKGMMGVILSDWRPLRASVPIIYFGADGKSHLQGVPDLPRVNKAAIVNQLEWARQLAPVGKLLDLSALLQGSPSWLPTAGIQDDVRTAVDRLLILPGFGCFVSGWILSYIRGVDGFALKLGDAVLTMEPESLRFADRPDLVAAFPDSGHLCGRAGFCCLFLGNPDSRLLEPPLMKVLLSDGGAIVFPVEVSKIRRLDHSEPLDSLFALYPALDREAFFPALKGAIRALHVARMSKLTPFRIRGASRVVVISLSRDGHDCRLAFEDILQNAPRFLPADCGIAIVGGPTHRHGEAAELFESLDETLTQPCSLAFCDDSGAAIYVLKELLLLIGAEAFIFVQADHFLTEEGWRAAGGLLDAAPADPVFFKVIDPDSLNEPVDAGCCLAWNRRALSAWVDTMPIVIEAPFGPGDFPSPPSPPRVVERGAFFSRPFSSSRIAALVNKSSRHDARVVKAE